jgi:hypothetical protein
MPCASCSENYNSYCAGGYCNSCCTNNLQSCCHAIICASGGPICPSGTLACVDVAEFFTTTSNVEVDSCHGHTINITNKTKITLSQFKQMFFADGEHFSVAEPPCCTDDINSIIESPWGIYDGPSHTCLADFSSTYAGTIDVSQNANLTYYYTRSDKYRDWVYVLTDTSGGSWIPKSFLQPNPNTAIMNYNKLGGRDFDPSGVFMGYMFSDISNVMQTFYAQKTIISNMERDIGTGKSCWSLCSRSSIFDQLYNLSFASTDNSCLKLSCGRTWEELINALREYSHYSYLLTGNNIITFDYMPADPSSNRFPENIFSILGDDIKRIQNYPITIPPTYDASHISATWTYNGGVGPNNEWELQTNTTYLLDISQNTPFFLNFIAPGSDITLYINIKIYNDHCNILPNTIRIAYVCRVDKHLDNYCGSGHRSEIQYS